MLTKELSIAERVQPRFIEPMYAEAVRELRGFLGWHPALTPPVSGSSDTRQLRTKIFVDYFFLSEIHKDFGGNCYAPQEI